MNRLRHYNHRLTTKGYYVAGLSLKTHQDKARYGKRYRSGRVTENPQGEWLEVADYAQWDLNGVALGHEYGDLDMGTVK